MVSISPTPETMEDPEDPSTVKSTPEVAKKNGQPVKRKSVGIVAMEQPLFEDERLPEGWSRSLIQRQGGATAGKFDVYIISPQMKKFRSRNELRSFFEKSSLSLDADDFDFSVCGKDLKNTSVKEQRNSSVKDQKNTSGSTDNVSVSKKSTPEKAKSKSAPRIKRTIEKKKVNRPKKDSAAQTAKMIRLLNKGPPASPSPEYPGFNPSPYFPWAAVKDKQKLKAQLHLKKWTPPRSPYNLIQENLYHDPWKLLVATILLNRTSGKVASPIIYDFFEVFPSPDQVGPDNAKQIAAMIRPLGLHEKRANIIVRFTEEYQRQDWVYPNELYGIGKYGNDSYRMFCIAEWRKVSPCDVMLIAYKNWLINNWRDFCEDSRLVPRRVDHILGSRDNI